MGSSIKTPKKQKASIEQTATWVFVKHWKKAAFWFVTAKNKGGENLPALAEETQVVEAVAQEECKIVERGGEGEKRDERELESWEIGVSFGRWSVGYLIHQSS